MLRPGEETESVEIGDTGLPQAYDEAPRSLLGGRFLLGERIGSGATGPVWAALDSTVERRVAIKILHRGLCDPASQERLRREVRASATGHSNVVTVYELHQEGDLRFLSMELIDGRSLSDLLAERGQLPMDVVCSIGRDMARALIHLDDLGLVHRDVKPGNIMILDGDAAKLCDLGLVRPIDHGSTVTRTAVAMGTPAYMAPEQAHGCAMSAATDIYGLGLTLYRCLTVWLDRLVTWMLHPVPARRPAARQVLEVLQQKTLPLRLARPARAAAAASIATVVALVTLGLALAAVRSPGGGAPTRPYPVTRSTDAGPLFDIVDRDGAVLGTLGPITDGWGPRLGLFYHSDILAIGDTDGDGQEDVVFADPSAGVRELQVSTPRAGELVLQTAIELSAEKQYGEKWFDNFVPTDVTLSDLDGDGAAEAIVVLRSIPYYPSEVRVLDLDRSRELLRVQHPGHLVDSQAGDLDGDGELELFLAGTCNFAAPRTGHESIPVVHVIGADWRRPGQQLDLFGPRRALARTVPRDLEVVSMSLPKLRVRKYEEPWEHAARLELVAGRGGPELQFSASQLQLDLESGARSRLVFVRTLRVDSDFNVADMMWMTKSLNCLDVDPSARELSEFARPRFWNGAGWQEEPCRIPHDVGGDG